MKNKVMIILMLALLVSATACSKTENQQEDKKTSKQVENTIDFDVKDFEDLEIAKEVLYDRAIDYLVEKPVIRLDYYPLEGNNEIKVEIKDNKIIFLDYKLDADLNEDGIVDEKDLEIIIDEFIKGSNKEKYDLDGDGEFTTKDIEYLSQRLLTEVVSFGFYDEKGNKLDIPNLSFGSKQIVDISKYANLALKEGDSVMVVPEDINGASVQNVTPPPNSSEDIVEAIMEKVIDEIITSFDREPEMYLVTWGISVKAIARTGVASNDGSSSVEFAGAIIPYVERLKEAFESKIADPHFGYHPDDMPLGNKKVRYNDPPDPNLWVAMCGDRPFSIRAVNYHEDLKSIRSSRPVTHATESGGRTVRVVVEVRDMAIVNRPASARNVTLKVNGWGNPSGYLDIERIGPGEGHTIEVETKIEKGASIEEVDLYSGDYKVVLRNDCCNFRMLITDAQSFFYDEHYVLALEVPNRIEVTGRVVDKETREPLENQKVELMIKCPIFDIEEIKPVWTNQQGRFTFEEVPYGVYELRVEDQQYMEVRLENAKETKRDLGDLVGEQTFDIELTYKDQFWGHSFSAKWIDVEINMKSERFEDGFMIMLDGYEQLNDEEKELFDGMGMATDLLPDQYTWHNKNIDDEHHIEHEFPHPVGLVILGNEAGMNMNHPTVGSTYYDPNSIYIEISPLYDIMITHVDVEAPWSGPAMDRYWLTSFTKKAYPTATEDDGTENIFNAKVSTNEFMGIFEGKTFERSGHSTVVRVEGRVRQGEYKLVIKPHQK